MPIVGPPWGAGRRVPGGGCGNRREGRRTGRSRSSSLVGSAADAIFRIRFRTSTAITRLTDGVGRPVETTAPPTPALTACTGRR